MYKKSDFLIMDETYSLFLDLVRFSAALLVFFHHAEFQQFNGAWLSSVASFGHDAVIVFFVLSGFVIKYVTVAKEKNIIDFSVSRLARIYSVSIPSIILVFIAVSFLNGAGYVSIDNVNWVNTIISSVFFLNQSFDNSIAIPLNGPYWSVCYEVWYYIIFATWTYFYGLKKNICVFVFCMMAGAKILLLFPVWLSGVLLFNQISNIKI